MFYGMYVTICGHKEKWKKISIIYPKIKNNYMISSHGRVLNLENNKILKHIIEPRGYHCVTLYFKLGGHKRFYIHDLVAKGFIPNKDKAKNQVNHLNGDKSGNYMENLEWTTNLDNIHHAISTGLRKSLYGENHPKNKYSRDFISKICELLEKNFSPRKILKQLNINCIGKEYHQYKRLIKHIKNREQWKEVSLKYKF
jgi:hypothetical protein